MPPCATVATLPPRAVAKLACSHRGSVAHAIACYRKLASGRYPHFAGMVRKLPVRDVVSPLPPRTKIAPFSLAYCIPSSAARKKYTFFRKPHLKHAAHSLKRIHSYLKRTSTPRVPTPHYTHYPATSMRSFADISIHLTPAYLRLFMYSCICVDALAHTHVFAHITRFLGQPTAFQDRQVGKCMCNTQKQYIHEYIQDVAVVSQNSQNTA